MSKNRNGDYFCGIKNPHDIEVLKKQIYNHLLIFQGRDPKLVGNLDVFKALAYTLRDLLIENWIKTQRINYTKKKKRIYYLSKDFEDYVRCQKEVSLAYRDEKNWYRKSILNVARMGKFSTDRTIREYAEQIWGVKV